MIDLARNLGHRGRRSLTAIIGAIWLASLFFDVFRVDYMEPVQGPGVVFLLSGWMGPMMGEFDWFANPAFVGLLIILWGKKAQPVAVSAISIVIIFVFLKNLMRDSLIVNEGGTPAVIEAYYAGFYLWMAALASSAIVGLTSVFDPKWIGQVPKIRTGETE